jgi:hypothetical protein
MLILSMSTLRQMRPFYDLANYRIEKIEKLLKIASQFYTSNFIHTLQLMLSEDP